MADGYHQFTFSDAGRRDIASIQEVLEPSLNLQICPLAEGRMEMDVSIRLLEGGCMVRKRLGNVHTARMASHIARDGNDDLCLVAGLSSRPMVMALPGRRHGRQELAIRWDAPAAVVSNGERFDALVAASDVLIVALPRKRLVPFVADPDDLFYRDVPHSAALSLLIGHAAMLTSDVGPLDAACGVHASAILRDLFVLALGPTRDGAEAAAPGLRAARLARIKSDIRAHRTNPELSLQWLSRRHSLPPRQIQTLFYMAGEGYAEFLRHARLDHARDLLTDPANAMRTVAEIAFLSGFGDLSWFNTCFRRRFGMTPTEVRATGLAGEP